MRLEALSRCRRRNVPRWLAGPCCALCLWWLPASALGQGDVRPPQAIERVDATYPDDAAGEADVAMIVTVERDGSVGPIEISESSGDDALDAAAVAAARQWRFEPAQRDGEPLRSRVRVVIRVAPPLFETTPDDDYPADPAPTPPPPAPALEPGATSDGELLIGEAPIDVNVAGERQSRQSGRGASNFDIDRDVLEAAPTQEGADVLTRAPGLFIARTAGAAVAHRYMLRGFDADHGQDIAFKVGGLPINMPSHIHGQGYADLGFLIGESVAELHVIEGVYDPRQGDFAVAGSIDVDLGSERRGWLLKSSYGSFNTFRQLALWAPEGETEETFGAVSYNRSDGFGENRKSAGADAVFQVRLGEGDRWSYRGIGFLHGARASTAGVLRADDVEAGRVGFYDVYPYATARGQNALSMRTMFGFFADYDGPSDEDGRRGAEGQVGAWLGYDNFRLQQNNTGFIQKSQVLDDVAGRGDLIEQQNRTLSLGVTSRYRTAGWHPADWAHGALELGFDGRLDVIDQAQNLIDAAVRNQTWDRRVDASVRGGDIGLWGDLDWSFPHVRARLGVRGDALFYDVDDRLGNFAPAIRPDDAFIAGFRRSAFGLAIGPRTSVEVMPIDWLTFRAAYGEGFRSPQARTLDDGEDAPFTKVRSGDVGVGLSWERLQVTLAGYLTHLSDDVAFDAREGRLERLGASRRVGGVLAMTTRPIDWLLASLSLTVVDAVLLEPPPPTADDPQPPFVDGQSLPYVPPVVGRVDIGAKHALVSDLGGETLRGRIGTGLSYLSPRPLPFGDTAAPVALLDAGAAIGWGPLEIGVDVFNMLDVEYAASVFNFPSDWNPDQPPSRTPERHNAAGAPLSWLTHLEIAL